MSAHDIVVHVKLDERTFKRFSRFDMLRLRKKWLRPAAFAAILIAFAVVALLSGRQQAGLIAAVLLAVGVGLPLVYFGTFFSQVNLQVSRFHLEKPRQVYTVTLNADGVGVKNDMRQEEAVQVRWKETQAAFRAKGCIYLYVNAARAFLLPDGQGSAPQEEIWEYLVKHMGEKCKEA